MKNKLFLLLILLFVLLNGCVKPLSHINYQPVDPTSLKPEYNSDQLRARIGELTPVVYDIIGKRVSFDCSVKIDHVLCFNETALYEYYLQTTAVTQNDFVISETAEVVPGERLRRTTYAVDFLKEYERLVFLYLTEINKANEKFVCVQNSYISNSTFYCL
jgi:hypothetical protein